MLLSVSKSPLVTRADNLAARAHEIITQTQIETLWAKVGKIVGVGSMRFGLMASTNIDYEIYVETPSVETGFGVISELARCQGVERIDFHNFMGTSDPGLYWQIFYRDSEGTLWDFDNWLVPWSHPPRRDGRKVCPCDVLCFDRPDS